MAEGLIGPNALTQMLPLLDRVGGRALRDRLLADSGIVELPDMSGLIPEEPVARLHRTVRAELPELARDLSREAGERTADYILTHRIPAPAQRALRWLPPRVSGPILSEAIARNAWTFAGSGEFEVERGWMPVFLLRENPVISGERSEFPICHWHAAVFERLFRVLVDDRLRARETACGAQGHDCCRFELTRV